jgi:hypothetical protein
LANADAEIIVLFLSNYLQKSSNAKPAHNDTQYPGFFRRYMNAEVMNATPFPNPFHAMPP